jgi:hypothetical protein
MQFTSQFSCRKINIRTSGVGSGKQVLFLYALVFFRNRTRILLSRQLSVLSFGIEVCREFLFGPLTEFILQNFTCIISINLSIMHSVIPFSKLKRMRNVN